MDTIDELSRNLAVLVPRPDLRSLSVSGGDRVEWLQGLVTCDMMAVGPGTGAWGLVLTKPGKILSDLFAVAASDSVLLVMPERAADRIAGWLEHHLIMEDAEVAAAPDFAWFSLHGPAAARIGADVARATNGVSAAIDVTGLGGAVVGVPLDRKDRVPALAEAQGVPALAPEDWDRLRVERLVPLYGVDMTEEQNPHEVSLDRRCVSWSKGCYLGQEAVCMQDMRGKVKRRLVVAELESGAPPGAKTAVTDPSGNPLGETRSAVTSRVFGHPAALVVVRAEAAAPGTRLVVGGVPAVVVEPNR